MALILVCIIPGRIGGYLVNNGYKNGAKNGIITGIIGGFILGILLFIPLLNYIPPHGNVIFYFFMGGLSLALITAILASVGGIIGVLIREKI